MVYGDLTAHAPRREHVRRGVTSESLSLDPAGGGLGAGLTKRCGGRIYRVISTVHVSGYRSEGL